MNKMEMKDDSNNSNNNNNNDESQQLRLVVDESEAREFCRSFLLPFRMPRHLQLMARNKYCTQEQDRFKMSEGSIILERKIMYFDATSSTRAEDDFIREMQKFELLARAGFYKNPKTGQTLHLSCMVIYITAYPLDEDDACDAFMTKIIQQRKEYRRSWFHRLETNIPQSPPKKVVVHSHPHLMSQLQTCLHQSPCKRHRMLKLDIDTKHPDLLRQLFQTMREGGNTVLMAIETRGGYHVVLERGPSCQNIWKFAQTINDGVRKQDQWITIEDNSGPMIVIPGTRQGGFPCRIVTDFWRQQSNT
jgi:hypothetical protein